MEVRAGSSQDGGMVTMGGLMAKGGATAGRSVETRRD